jgi:dTDP-3-amino-3,4,6-trideoxy-alpha-D-glucose transaminase
MEAAVATRRGGTVRFVALEQQHAPIEHELKDAFARLLKSSAYTLGVEVERFEADFAEYSEARHCVGVASGTAALSLMLEAYGIGAGDEVIVPAHTFIASALAVAHVGAIPVLCDVVEGTGLIDPDAARAAVGPRTAAILAVHLYGQSCDIGGLDAFARPAGLLVLEDAAQAHGARYRGRRVGSLGAAAAFSFYPSKNLGALGDGGAICTDDDVLAARLRRLRNLGQRTKGEHVELGYNERLDGLQAALLRVKLTHLDEWNEARRAHAAHYRRLLEPEVRVVEERPETPSVHHLFPARFENRDAVAGTLRDLGIECGVHYTPAVHQHAAWANSTLRHGEVPNSEAWAAEELSLPMHPDLTPDEIERVAEAVYEAISIPNVRSGENRC